MKQNKLQFSFLLFCTCFLFMWVYCLFLFSKKSIIMEFELFSLSTVSFSFAFIFDSVSMSFSMIVLLISSSVFMFATKYMEEDEFYWRFIWILLSFVISMNFLIFSGSLFFLLLGWDGLGITSFALIIYYQSKESLSAGFQTLMINRLGDVIIVCSSFFYVFLGQYSFLTLSLNSSILVLLICIAGLTKSAQFPFSSWLPAAMAAPTPVSALVHSSTLVTAGIYLIIRFSTNINLWEETSSVLLFCGSITCFLGGTAAVFENDLKKIIALSTLSQLGVMVFCLGLSLPLLTLFHLYTHALFKALLFLAAGTILMCSFGNQDIRMLGSLGLSMPLCVVMFNISSLCLVGAPFLSAFFSKHLILEKMLMSNINIFSLILMALATCSTAIYVARSLKAICWFKPSLTLVSLPKSLKIYLPMILLGTAAIMFGKMYALLDFSLLEIVFISNWNSIFINILSLSGLWVGLMFMGRCRSFMFSYLFFLSPVYSYSSKLLAPMQQNMMTLDYGWLEVGYNFNIFLKNLVNKTIIFNWPGAFSFHRIIWSFILLMFAFNFYF